MHIGTTTQDLLDLMTVQVPEGRRGSWKVERFEVDEAGAKRHNFHEQLNQIKHGVRPRFVVPGWYTRLVYSGDVVMSDTPSEREEHIEAVRQARGHCLVMGLGLGMVVQAMLTKSSPALTVTVVEKSEEVCTLVAPHYQERFGGKFILVHADALTWRPPRGAYWDVVWHDIWTEISSENLPEMKRLKSRYRTRASWQEAWMYDACRYMLRRERYY